jgi:hypothetical protein
MSIHAGFVVDKVVLRFITEFFGFPLSISFHHGSLYSYIIWGMKNRPTGGRNSQTQSHPINMNNNRLFGFKHLRHRTEKEGGIF